MEVDNVYQSNGAPCLYTDDNRMLLKRGVNLASEFFQSAKHVFVENEESKTPKTSQLVHPVVTIAMGYATEALHVMTGAEER
ncbi:MAG: hypothetical protein P8Y47_13695 [Alphaproteobacteria bacterium]